MRTGLALFGRFRNVLDTYDLTETLSDRPLMFTFISEWNSL